MRLALAIASAAAFLAVLSTIACGRGNLLKQYEYEEEVYLALDGTATVYVNASIPALDALRGAAFDTAPNARFDRDGVQAYFTTPVTRVARVSDSRRSNRRFVHVRLDVDDVRRLGGSGAVRVVHVSLCEGQDDRFVYRQAVGALGGQGRRPGRELDRATSSWRFAFTCRATSHRSQCRRGETTCAATSCSGSSRSRDRLRGQPLEMAAQMETESILAHTLWLFGATALAVGVTFGLVVWMIARRGQQSKLARVPQGRRRWQLADSVVAATPIEARARRAGRKHWNESLCVRGGERRYWFRRGRLLDMPTEDFGAKPVVLRCARCGKFVDWEEARVQIVCACKPRLELPPVLVREATNRDRSRGRESVVSPGLRPHEDRRLRHRDGHRPDPGARRRDVHRSVRCAGVPSVRRRPSHRGAGHRPDVAAHRRRRLSRRRGGAAGATTETSAPRRCHDQRQPPGALFLSAPRLSAHRPRSSQHHGSPACAGPAARRGSAGIPVRDEIRLEKRLQA